MIQCIAQPENITENVNAFQYLLKSETLGREDDAFQIDWKIAHPTTTAAAGEGEVCNVKTTRHTVNMESVRQGQHTGVPL